MKPPKCRLCAHEHYSYEPHIFDTPLEPKHRAVKEIVANVANSVANTRYQKWREANPDLYRERQRDYMRKKRAKTVTD